MSKRAVIYVRTSSEKQGEKVSPREQEAACRELAQERGYTVLNVYKDITRYKVGKNGKLVEPSGTRADRPALRRMIAAAKESDMFDVILAWREDRLYRSFRPMLDVLELVEEHDLDIELARETFDRRMAPVKAWAAKMELEGIKERVMMGRVGRLKDKKLLGYTGILGYDVEDGQAVINDQEAETVQFIFNQVAWGDSDYPGGVPIKEVRQRLIERGYKQKTSRAKTPWARQIIYTILRCETYLGERTYRLNGDTYRVPVWPIIDRETFDKANERIQKRKRYPVRNAKELGFLLVGKVYGPCGHRLHYQIDRYSYATLADGTKKKYKRKRPLAYCICGIAQQSERCDFMRFVPMYDVEQAAWGQVGPFLLDPQNVKQVASELVTKWQGESETHQAEVDRLERHLARLKEERKWVILQGRKGTLTDSDMAEQLAVLTDEERTARRELGEAKQAANAGADLLGMVNELAKFLTDYEGELRELVSTPVKEMSIEQRKKVQRWFDAVVVRVDMEGDENNLRIQTDAFGLLRTVGNQSKRICSL
jgi:DNA invertase Pin-like site-specific DNA recombinase